MLPSPSYRFGTYQPAPADSPSPFELPSPDIPLTSAGAPSSLARASTNLTPPGTGASALGRSYSLPPPSLSASSSFQFFGAAGLSAAHHPLGRSGSLALSTSTAFRELGNGCLDLSISACGSTSGALGSASLYDTVESAGLDRRPSAASTCFSSSLGGVGGRRDSIWSSRASFDSAASSLVSPAASEDKDRPSTGASSVFALSPFMVDKGDQDVRNMVQSLTGHGSGEEDGFSFALDCSLAATRMQLSASSPAFQPAVTAASFTSRPNQLATSTPAQQQQQHYSQYQQQRPHLHRQQPFAPTPTLGHGFDAALHFAQLSLASSGPSYTHAQPTSHFATPTLVPQLSQQPTSLPLAPVPALALDPSYPLPPHTTAAIAALHNGRVPALSQLAPPSPPSSQSGHSPSGSPPAPLAPIVNTGNVGPMVVQQGDWCCGACGFTNWRRRVVCIKCFPHASPTIVRTGGAASAAAAAAAVTSPLAKKQRTGSLPVTLSFAPSAHSMQQQHRYSFDAGQPHFTTLAATHSTKDDQRTANYQRKFPQRGVNNQHHSLSRLQLSHSQHSAQQQHSSQVLGNAASPYAPLVSAPQHQHVQASHAYAPLIWNDDILHGGARDVFSA